MEAEREASPTAAVIDSQSVTSAEKGACIDPHGYDAREKIKAKKRHSLVDTTGLTLASLNRKVRAYWLLASIRLMV